MEEAKSQYQSKIVATKKYKRRSSLGGLTQEQILVGPYVAIAHQTPMSNFRKIMKEGKLQHRIERAREGKKVGKSLAGHYDPDVAGAVTIKSAKDLAQFPGIYTHLVTCFNEKWLPQRGNVTFVFSLALLKQGNWHMNIRDNYGIINNLSFTPRTLAQYAHVIGELYGSDEDQCTGNYIANELVFHDAISLGLLEEVICSNDDRSKVERVLKEVGRTDVAPISNKDDRAMACNRKKVRGVNSLAHLSKAKPQLCFYSLEKQLTEGIRDDYIAGFFAADIEPYELKCRTTSEEEKRYNRQRIGQNCGVPNAQYLTDKQLNDRVGDILQGIYFEDKPRKPVVAQAPYWPKSYSDRPTESKLQRLSRQSPWPRGGAGAMEWRTAGEVASEWVPFLYGAPGIKTKAPSEEDWTKLALTVRTEKKDAVLLGMRARDLSAM